VNNGKDAIEWMRKKTPDLVLCDFKLDDITGKEMLPNIKQLHPGAPVIIITGYSDIKDAVEVMKLGAYDYVTKPLYPDEILLTIKKALSEKKDTAAAPQNEQAVSNGQSRRTVQESYNGHYLSTNSPEYINIVKQIEMVAPTNYSVIIYGESGSGKEAVAQQIHMKSKRKDKPFIAIDCGALSKELAGSELFGHEKGAFTGALASKTGSFELANGGTIFLDEIGNLTYDIQVSLLRVVQERKIKKLGGTKDIPLDVRIIVASNENLWNAMFKGKFREDLYHRFNEFSITLPPLRERKSDIMIFAKHFLKLTNAELGKNIQGFSDEVESIFLQYPWYGNLRELKNVIK
ncbi:MAG: sigma-54 dependent transcriptional regulator, partial [Taibaiella sp.]|nr:sigma-54 dependent transcriptional regulator [Taibaiella sp.]